ncbi:hypothetical protein QOZ80_1BG0093810 [Eleusine coracana subsp. coracana]|nr:hypothetical protein QOZ80_1BG0093810 [Eleusine coracana subsp. coracana]
MKLTCLSTNGAGGGSYHSPASHILEVEGLRLLLDCPIDLSALTAFAPVPLAGDAEGLIRAVPRYWSPAAAAAAKAGGVEAVLVSSAMGMLGLPFLTRLPGFANIKVYGTEVAIRIGKLMMGSWWGCTKAVNGNDGTDLTSLMPLYREHRRMYAENQASQIWRGGPRASITYLPSLVFVSAHAIDFDHGSVKENDVILFSDFSSLNDMDEDNEKLEEGAMDETNGNISYLCNNDDIKEEIERISFICSCIIDAIKSGGSVLIPIGRLGVILLLLEHISELLHSSSMKVPIFMISETAEEIIPFTNALPEWLCKSRQEKLFAGEALFGHVKLLKEGKLFLFPQLYSKGLLAAWKEPCIVFCPHWSLRLGLSVHLLRRWRADKRCLLVLEQGNDAELSLKPFMPLAIEVLECSFLSGVKVGKVDPLLGLLKPKFVLLPEDLKSRCPVKDRPWSFLYYSRGETIKVPILREDFEVHFPANVDFGLQPRQLDESTAVARLRSKLLVSNGQYVLAAAEKRSEQSKQHLLHWGAVEPDHLLSALQEKGMGCSFVDDNKSACTSEYTILITSPGDAMVKITSSGTRIYCDEEKTSQHIYDALSSVCNGI